MRVDVLRDRDAGVAEDLRELEDVAAGREEEAGEGVAEILIAGKGEVSERPQEIRPGLPE